MSFAKASVNVKSANEAEVHQLVRDLTDPEKVRIYIYIGCSLYIEY